MSSAKGGRYKQQTRLGRVNILLKIEILGQAGNFEKDFRLGLGLGRIEVDIKSTEENMSESVKKAGGYFSPYYSNSEGEPPSVDKKGTQEDEEKVAPGFSTGHPAAEVWK